MPFLIKKQSLQCSWTSSLEQSDDGPQTAGLVLETFAEDVFIWAEGPQHSVNLLN